MDSKEFERRQRNRRRTTDELLDLYQKRKGVLPTREIEDELAARETDPERPHPDDNQKSHGGLSEHHWR